MAGEGVAATVWIAAGPKLVARLPRKAVKVARTQDIDEVLRRMAAQDRATELDSAGGWARVRQGAEEARRARRRPRLRTLALAASLGLLLVMAAMWRDVGTEDFTLVPDGLNSRGHNVFSGRHRPYSISIADDSLGVEEMQRMSEEILTASEAGDAKLLSVHGTTIAGMTHLLVLSEVPTSFGPQTVNANIDISMNQKMTEESARILTRFMSTRYAETARAIKEGRAKSIESLDVVAGGRVFRCDRWQFFYPEFGTVIYWRGFPLP